MLNLLEDFPIGFLGHNTADTIHVMAESMKFAYADRSSDLVVRAPQVGRFYHRAAPDRPAYVSEGQEVNPGDTLGLIEVMKTFFQVRLGDPALGAGLPERARVVRHLVPDGAEVAQGDPILELAPLD